MNAVPMGAKLAVYSHTLPPQSNGQAIVLQRLLESADGEKLLFFGPASLLAKDLQNGKCLAGDVVLLPDRSARLRRIPRLGRWLDALLGGTLRFIGNLWRIRRQLKQRQCDVLVVCTGPWYELPLCWLAARLTGIPWIAYVFDWYGRRFDLLPGIQGRVIGKLARWLEGPLLRRADQVVVPNETLQREYRQRYGIEAVVIANPHGGEDLAKVATEPWPQQPGDVRVRLTGAIYEAHFDAVRNVVEAAAQIEQPQVTLEAFTEVSEAWLRERAGITGRCIIRQRVPLDEVFSVLETSDVLLLPLAFDSPFPDIVRTSAPAKFGDYLAAGRPILVHAPADSFVSEYCRKYQCAMVVDQNDPAAVLDALRTLIADHELRATLQRNALARAAADFSVAVSRRRLAGVLNEVLARPRWAKRNRAAAPSYSDTGQADSTGESARASREAA